MNTCTSLTSQDSWDSLPVYDTYPKEYDQVVTTKEDYNERGKIDAAEEKSIAIDMDSGAHTAQKEELVNL